MQKSTFNIKYELRQLLQKIQSVLVDFRQKHPQKIESEKWRDLDINA